MQPLKESQCGRSRTHKGWVAGGRVTGAHRHHDSEAVGRSLDFMQACGHLRQVVRQASQGLGMEFASRQQVKRISHGVKG